MYQADRTAYWIQTAALMVAFIYFGYQKLIASDWHTTSGLGLAESQEFGGGSFYRMSVTTEMTQPVKDISIDFGLGTFGFGSKSEGNYRLGSGALMAIYWQHRYELSFFLGRHEASFHNGSWRGTGWESSILWARKFAVGPAAQFGIGGFSGLARVQYGAPFSSANSTIRTRGILADLTVTL